MSLIVTLPYSSRTYKVLLKVENVYLYVFKKTSVPVIDRCKGAIFEYCITRFPPTEKQFFFNKHNDNLSLALTQHLPSNILKNPPFSPFLINLPSPFFCLLLPTFQSLCLSFGLRQELWLHKTEQQLSAYLGAMNYTHTLNT